MTTTKHEPGRRVTGETYPFKVRYYCSGPKCDYKTRWLKTEEIAQEAIEAHCADKNFKVPTQAEIVNGLEEAFKLGMEKGMKLAYEKAKKELAV